MNGRTGPTETGTAELSPRFLLSEMCESDLDQVLALERECFPTPWTRSGFLTALKTDFGRGWVILDRERTDRAVLGYLCCWARGGAVQVVNICVAPARRRQGLGRLLMQVALSWAGLRRMGKVCLEVRTGNAGAISLYRELGFRPVGSRPGYYPDTGEDALLYELELSREGGSGPRKEPRTPPAEAREGQVSKTR